jgi:hypothetical protein
VLAGLIKSVMLLWCCVPRRRLLDRPGLPVISPLPKYNSFPMSFYQIHDPASVQGSMNKSDFISMSRMRRLKQQRGAALVTMLVASTLVLAAGSALLTTTTTSFTDEVDVTAALQASYAADAGLQQAINILLRHVDSTPAGSKKMSFRTAVTPRPTATWLVGCNNDNDTSAEARLSSWLAYSNTYPDRVPIVAPYDPGNGLAFKVVITDPDNVASPVDPVRLLVKVTGFGPRGAVREKRALIVESSFRPPPPGCPGAASCPPPCTGRACIPGSPSLSFEPPALITLRGADSAQPAAPAAVAPLAPLAAPATPALPASMTFSIAPAVVAGPLGVGVCAGCGLKKYSGNDAANPANSLIPNLADPQINFHDIPNLAAVKQSFAVNPTDAVPAATAIVASATNSYVELQPSVPLTIFNTTGQSISNPLPLILAQAVPSVIQNSYPDILATAATAQQWVSVAKQIAQVRSPSNPSNGNLRSSYYTSYDTATNDSDVTTNPPAVFTFVDGDCNLRAGSNRAGLLVVRGTLTMDNSANFNGLIMVLGGGTVVRSGNSATTGVFLGAMAVARFDANANSFGAPSFTTTGTGNSTWQYHSGWVLKALLSPGPAVINIKG